MERQTFPALHKILNVKEFARSKKFQITIAGATDVEREIMTDLATRYASWWSPLSKTSLPAYVERNQKLKRGLARNNFHIWP